MSVELKFWIEMQSLELMPHLLPSLSTVSERSPDKYLLLDLSSYVKYLHNLAYLRLTRSWNDLCRKATKGSYGRQCLDPEQNSN